MAKQARGRYYRRHRKIATVAGHNPDGSTIIGPEVSALITRYRYGASRRKPHYVYWHDGRFYRAQNCATEIVDGKPGGWVWAIVPIDKAAAWDAYASQSDADGIPVVRLEIDGTTVRATGAKGTPYAGAPLLAGGEGPDYVADLLGLDKPERKQYRPRHMRVA